MRAVFYAPFIPLADPTASADLYDDSHGRTFRRDAWVLSLLGASTLLLNPWHSGTHHQGLYNATSLKVLRSLDTVCNGTAPAADADCLWHGLSLQPEEALLAEASLASNGSALTPL